MGRPSGLYLGREVEANNGEEMVAVERLPEPDGITTEHPTHSLRRLKTPCHFYNAGHRPTSMVVIIVAKMKGNFLGLLFSDFHGRPVQCVGVGVGAQDMGVYARRVYTCGGGIGRHRACHLAMLANRVRLRGANPRPHKKNCGVYLRSTPETMDGEFICAATVLSTVLYKPW